jgi:hypothetical protein
MSNKLFDTLLLLSMSRCNFPHIFRNNKEFLDGEKLITNRKLHDDQYQLKYSMIMK